MSPYFPDAAPVPSRRLLCHCCVQIAYIVKSKSGNVFCAVGAEVFESGHLEPIFVYSPSHVTTDGQSASLSWNKAPIWKLLRDFYYCQTVAGLWLQLS
jgi:hypothetical protein